MENASISKGKLKGKIKSKLKAKGMLKGKGGGKPLGVAPGDVQPPVGTSSAVAGKGNAISIQDIERIIMQRKGKGRSSKLAEPGAGPVKDSCCKRENE